MAFAPVFPMFFPRAIFTIFLVQRRRLTFNRGGAQKPIDVSGKYLANNVAPADYVPRIQLEEKTQECLSKEETIQVVFL